ncbi:MAG TPA: hypothetical protein VEW94_04065 [Chloroflexia bacterium]|nr:hypothetical protein [Chloroflexia bacterium]
MEELGELQVSQDGEIPVQLGRSGAFAWRYAYARSADTRAASDPGQDYLTFRYEGGTFAFVLCDGVSQSFFGDIAARFLGDALLSWAWSDLPIKVRAQDIRDGLNALLKDLVAKSSDMVRGHAIPKNVPWILRDVLEQKRALGSQTTFICGRIDQPNDDLPDGRLVLAWLGDSRVRLWGPAGERTTEFGETFRTEERWSTLNGPVGSPPHVFVAPLRNGGKLQVARLMLYSDGLATLDSHELPPGDVEINRLIEEAGVSPTSDDISFLDIHLRGVPAHNVPARDVPVASVPDVPVPDKSSVPDTPGTLDKPNVPAKSSVPEKPKVRQVPIRRGRK